jgi:cobalt-zinc-cadmium resistance protein CzcA
VGRKNHRMLPLQEAVQRLAIVVPISLVILFLLLYGTFGNLRDASLLLGTVPLALIGGILSLLVTHTNFSISAVVGFISLFGVSVVGGVILVSRIKQLQQERLPLCEAIRRGAELQLRPVLMAALAAAIGLLPASVATGIGSETQQPLARVVVGGMLTSAVLILLVLPAMYRLVYRHAEQHPEDAKVLASQQGRAVPGT